MIRRIAPLFFFLLVVCSNVSTATSPELRPNHPKTYTVQKGDTLWGIAEKFLQKPWEWEALWAANQNIRDPNQLFPGDVITLEMHNGAPIVRLSQQGVVHLSPKIRVSDYQKQIPVVPFKLIKPFLSHDLVLYDEDMNNTPYVLTTESEHISGGKGSIIYVRGLVDVPEQEFSIYRSGEPLEDPESKAILGNLTQYIGRAKLIAAGDPAKMVLVDAPFEVLKGDRLLPASSSFIAPVYTLHPPATPIQGVILNVLGGVTQIGQYNVVVINQGIRDDLRVGDVLAIQLQGAVVTDPFVGKKTAVKLPDETVGELLVFRTFEAVSLGLVMRARKAMHIGDIVTNP